MYADLYFLGNAVLDLFLLHLTGQITGEKASGRRLLMGALCGGSGALLWLYVRGGRYTKPIDLLAALLLAAVMCRLVWRHLRRKKFWIQTGWFVGVGVLMEGCIRFCAAWLLKGTPAFALFAAACLLLGGAGTALRLYYRFSGRGGRIAQVHCQIGEKEVTFIGWLDSGNLLRDPIGQRPVIIADPSLLEGISMEQAIPVPYQTVGVQGQILWAIEADSMEISRGSKAPERVQALLAPAPGKLSVHGCRAVLPAEWCVEKKE